MQTVTIAGGIDISRVILGTANAGISYTEGEAFQMWDRFSELGGNCFDTARVYSDWVPGETHRSERILGDWIRERNIREKLVICTKCAHPPLGNWNARRVSRREIHDDLHGSLETLGVDSVGLLYMHMDAPEVPVDEIVDMLAEHVDAGLARCLGCSNWSPDRIRAAHEYASRSGKRGFVAHQVLWNLGSGQLAHADSRHPELNEDGWNALTNCGMAAIAYSSQAQGYFSKVLSTLGSSTDKARLSVYNTPENEELAALIRRIATSRECSINQVLVAYLLTQRLATAAVVGSRTVSQVEDSVGACKVSLTDHEMGQLRETASQTWLA